MKPAGRRMVVRAGGTMRGRSSCAPAEGRFVARKNLGQPQHVCGWQRGARSAVFTPRCQNFQGSGSSQRMPQL